MELLRHLLSNDHGEWMILPAAYLFLKNLPAMVRLYWGLYVRKAQPPNSNAPGYSTEDADCRAESRSGSGGSPGAGSEDS